MTKNKKDLTAQKSEDIELNNQPDAGNVFLESKTTEEVEVLERENSKNEDSSKKKKKMSFKKKTLMHQLKTLGALMLMGVFTGCGLGVWYFNTELRNDTNYDIDPTPYQYDINAVMSNNFNITNQNDYATFVETATSQGKTPLDLTPADNFALAEYHASLASSWTAIGEGQINTIITQSLYSEKKFDGNKYTFVNISISSMVKVAKCYEYIKGAKDVVSYTGASPQSTSATWNKDATKIANADFKEQMGNLPNAIQPYLISDKTITNGNTKENVIYDELSQSYSFTIELDTVNSVLLYAHQVKSTGGLQTYPKFNSIIQTITIDKDWNLISIEIKDKYDAVVGIKASCTGYLKNYYTFNQPVEMPV